MNFDSVISITMNWQIMKEISMITNLRREHCYIIKRILMKMTIKTKSGIILDIYR